MGVKVPGDSPAARFGVKNELALASDAGFSLENTSQAGDGGSTLTLSMRPAVDFFIIDDLSVGGTFGLDYSHYTGGHSTRFSIGPRVGYNFTLGQQWSIWPKIGLSYNTTNFSVDQNANNNVVISRGVSNNALALNLFVPVMFHPVEHFFVGLGPALDVDLTGDAKATTIAIRLTIGGWVGPLAKR